jgi:soluble lytic murein transglycosylase
MTSRVLSIIKKHAPHNRNSKLLADAIVRESLAQNYDPLFVAAVIKTESLFNPVARSHKGAQGLMQIMPATGVWLANRESLPRLKLTDTRHNLRLGITYLKQLESEYNGDRVFTLVAYNWGPGHVQMASGGKRRIPGECLRYAVRILNDYRRWKSGII